MHSLSLMVTVGVANSSHCSVSTNLQFVVGLGDKVSPTDIEEGMRVG